MRERRGSAWELRRSAEALSELARQLDAKADAFWLLAGDCVRWGLSEDAHEARRQACGMRVHALMNRARAVGLSARLAGTDDSLF